MVQVDAPPPPGRGRRWLALTGTPLHPSIWSAVADRLDGPLWAPDVTPPAGIREPQRHVAERVAARARATGGTWSVVGHSFGGQVALELALAAPGLVDRLVVVGSRDTPFPAFAAAADALDAGGPVDVEGALTRWFRPAERQAHPEVVADIAGQLRRADRASWATGLRGIARFDAADRVAAITAPVSVLAAGHDPVSPPEVMAAMAGRLPGAAFAVWPEAAHLSPFLYPDRLAAALVAGDPAGPAA